MLTDPLGLMWTKEQTGKGQGVVVRHPRVLLWPGRSLWRWLLASEPGSHLEDEDHAGWPVSVLREECSPG